MRDTIELTDEQIENKFDELGYGLTVEDLVFTRESVEDFKKALKNDYTDGFIDDEGSDFLIMLNCQTRKSEPRRDVVIIDFGEVRAVYC